MGKLTPRMTPTTIMPHAEKTERDLQSISKKLIPSPYVDPAVSAFLSLYVEERRKQSMADKLHYDAAISGIFRATDKVMLSNQTLSLLIWYALLSELDFEGHNEHLRGIGLPSPASALSPKWFYLVTKCTRSIIKEAEKKLSIYKHNLKSRGE